MGIDDESWNPGDAAGVPYDWPVRPQCHGAVTLREER